MFLSRALKPGRRKAVGVSMVVALSCVAAAELSSTSPAAASNTPSVAASALMPQAAPVGDLNGWRQVYRDDFNTNVALGSFPGAVSSKWNAYPSPWKDTTGYGMYDPGHTVSIGYGVLNEYIHTEGGQPRVAAILPKVPGTSKYGQTYGRYAVRFRGDKLTGYKMAWMLWPDSGSGNTYGEIDFPERNLDSPNVFAFMHHTNSTGPGDQDYAKVPIDFTQWHTTVIEWSPNLVKFFLDGAEIGRSTTRVPNTAMHWVLQTETSITAGVKPAASVAGNVQIDWVAAWAYDKTAVAGSGTSGGTSGGGTTSGGTDTIAPTVGVAGVTEGAVRVGVVPLSATVEDASGVTQVKWYVDGQEVGYDGNGAPWADSWNSATVGNGAHRMFAKARDAAGNWGTSASVGFSTQN